MFSYIFGYDIKEDIEADPKSKRQKYLVCEQIKESKNIKLKPRIKPESKKKKVTFSNLRPLPRLPPYNKSSIRSKD